MTEAYKLNDVAYMIESNHYIREGKIIHNGGNPDGVTPRGGMKVFGL